MSPTITALNTVSSDASFWVSFAASFWAQLLATFIIAIIGSIIIPPFIRWTQRARLKFYKEDSRRDSVFEFTQATDGEWEASLHLKIRNEGSKTMERFYWEMYLPNDISVAIIQTPPYAKEFTTSEKVEGNFLHRYGYIEIPIFPLDSVHFVHELKLKVKAKRTVNIYYFFRTDLGDSPWWAWIALYYKKHHWLNSLTIS